jgi:hypothetical protein
MNCQTNKEKNKDYKRNKIQHWKTTDKTMKPDLFFGEKNQQNW